MFGSSLALSAWIVSSQAGTYYLESEPVTSKTPVLEVARVAAEAGVQGRVVRLYLQDEGWRYLFRSEERATDGDLRAWLDKLAELTSQRIVLVSSDNGELEVVASSSIGSDAREPSPADPLPEAVPADRALEAQEILRRVVRAHGGPAAAGGIDEVPTVVFRFDRLLVDRKVSHLFVRRGEDIYLQVDVTEGKGTSSRAGIVRGVPWMDGAGDEDLDPIRVREVLQRFSPGRVLSTPMAFTAGLPGDRAYDLLAVGDSVKVGGRSAVLLQWTGDRSSVPLALTVEANSWRILEVTTGTDDEAVRWVFEGYAELGNGMIYPGKAEAWQGQERVDRIVVRELDLDPTLLPEWFPNLAR